MESAGCTCERAGGQRRRLSGCFIHGRDDNIIPFVPGDEQKMETESQKMLGYFNGAGIDKLEMVVSALVRGCLSLTAIWLTYRLNWKRGPRCHQCATIGRHGRRPILLPDCPARQCFHCNTWITSTVRNHGGIAMPAAA